MIKAVIFDVGGVLAPRCWDTDMIIDITKKALEEKGIKVPSSFDKVYYDTMEEAWLELLRTHRELGFGEPIRRTLRKLNIPFNEDQIQYAVEKLDEGVFCELHEKAEFVLKTLKKMGIKIGVISNAPGNFPIKVLKRNGLDKYIDFAVTSYQIGVVKPHPKIFKVVLDALKVSPKNAIFVGDVPIIDVKGAKKVGMRTVLIEECDPIMKARGCDKVTEDSEPDFTIKDLEEIIDIVRRLNSKESEKGE